jgi:hypothetical protein
MSQLLESAKEHARDAVAALTEPDADIMGHFLWVGPHGLGLMPLYMMTDDDAKDGIAQAMTASLVVGLADEAVHLTSSWLAMVDPADPTVNVKRGTTTVQIADRPDRREVVTLMHCTREQITLWSAPMIRYPDRPPTMGAWETIGEPLKPEDVRGRFGAAINRGLAMVPLMPPAMVAMINEGWAAGEQQELIQSFMNVQHDVMAKATHRILPTPTVEVQPLPNEGDTA